MSADHLNQEQFLNVIDRDEAERRFHAVLDLRPLENEDVALHAALGRTLANDILAPIDVPGFDRANVDGFAVQAADTFGAAEESPRTLRINPESVHTGSVPTVTVLPGTATSIATGAIVPRGADAVVMIEYTDMAKDEGGRMKDEASRRVILHPSSFIRVSRPVSPGSNVTYAGTDIGRGETVLRRGEFLTSRETGVLAALGISRVSVIRRPRVAIISTGDELVAPGESIQHGQIFDSNATVLADAVRELDAEPVMFGVVPDDHEKLAETLKRALTCDVVLLSGGTSKGAGDVSYRVVANVGPPGIVAHGVALKPGKPLCLAAATLPGRRPVPVVVLPGFPTSAIFTFHEFVAPVIRRLAGRRAQSTTTVKAYVPQRVNSERGRTEYVLVGLVDGSTMAAYPMGKGSGSVTAFGRADGYIVIPRQTEYLDAGEIVDVHLLGQGLQPVDLVVIGSHCIGLDWLLGQLHERGFRSKFLAVGSTGGLAAARRGECDLAGIHLLDETTGVYNQHLVGDDLTLIRGYPRLQGIVYRLEDQRFAGATVAEAMARALADPNCIMVNRNRGSGTRVLIDQLLGSKKPAGYWSEARSHNAVTAAVAQGRADWGVAISQVADKLGFIPLQAEQFDFVVPRSRLDRAAVSALCDLLREPETQSALKRLGFFSEESRAP